MASACNLFTNFVEVFVILSMLLGEFGNYNVPASSVDIQEFGSENIFLNLNRNSHVSDRHHTTVHAAGYNNHCLHSNWRAAPAAFCLPTDLFCGSTIHIDPRFGPRPTRSVCTILLIINSNFWRHRSKSGANRH